LQTATTRELVVFASAQKRAFACWKVGSAMRRLQKQTAKMVFTATRAYAMDHPMISTPFSRHVAVPS
jgi:hypothetical protein